MCGCWQKMSDVCLLPFLLKLRSRLSGLIQKIFQGSSFILESKKYKHFQFGFEGRYKKRMGQNIDRSERLKSALLELNDSNHD